MTFPCYLHPKKISLLNSVDQISCYGTPRKVTSYRNLFQISLWKRAHQRWTYFEPRAYFPTGSLNPRLISLKPSTAIQIVGPSLWMCLLCFTKSWDQMRYILRKSVPTMTQRWTVDIVSLTCFKTTEEIGSCIAPTDFWSQMTRVKTAKRL